jgi:hypothetical protein
MPSRGDLESLTERLIEVLDDMDGGTDLGPNGDELDDFCSHNTDAISYPG